MLFSSFLRKSFAGLLAIALAASIFTACGKKDENNGQGSDNEKKEEKTDAGKEDFIRGKAALETKDYKTAITHLMLAAEKGSTEAMIELAKCYERGAGVERNEKESVKWMRKAAENGSAEAQYMMGAEAYAEGWGVEKNLDTALEWMLKAAENKSDSEYVARAQLDLFDYYIDIEEDEQEALKWLRRAAENKTDSYYSANAQYNLGNLYEKGEFVKKDRNEAIKWYRKAANSKSDSSSVKDAKKALERLGAE